MFIRPISSTSQIFPHPKFILQYKRATSLKPRPLSLKHLFQCYGLPAESHTFVAQFTETRRMFKRKSVSSYLPMIFQILNLTYFYLILFVNFYYRFNYCLVFLLSSRFWLSTYLIPGLVSLFLQRHKS